MTYVNCRLCIFVYICLNVTSYYIYIRIRLHTCIVHMQIYPLLKYLSSNIDISKFIQFVERA